ncbi:MAG: hypothetical protein SFV19_04240 [Rhodospirillaceae bacterium]|nr:hypothetical protein [Rhodospirillaceae bacterium]
MNTFGQIQRRSMVRGIGAAIGSALFAKEAYAQQAASGLSKRDLDATEMKGEPAVFEDPLRGNFNLDDPYGNRMASLKMTNNLSGKRTYIPMFGRVYLGPQGKPGSAIYGFLGLWTWQLQWPDPKKFPNVPKGTVVQRAAYTAVMTDPVTFKPAKTVFNHVLKKEVETKNSLFAESYLFFPDGTGSSLDRPEFMDSPEQREAAKNPHVKWGKDLSIFLAGLFQNEGPNQPRMDGSIWSGDYNRIMDPKDDLVPVDYNFAGLMRAWERPWMGHAKGDDTQILFNVKGTKLHSVDDFPEIMKEHVLKVYPERV